MPTIRRTKSVIEQIKAQRSEKRVSNIRNNFTFGVVANKLIWLDFHRKLVQQIDLDCFEPESNEKLSWTMIHSCGFTIKELLYGFSDDDYK